MAVAKKSRFCGPGCECRDCVNLPVQQSVESESEGEGSDDEGSDTHSDNSFSSDDQLEVITNTDDFLFDFPDIF